MRSHLTRTLLGAAWSLIVWATIGHPLHAMTLEESDGIYEAATKQLMGGDAAGAIPSLREVAAFWKSHFGPGSDEASLALGQLGVALMNTGNHQEAIESLTECVRIRTKLKGELAPEVQGPRHNLSRCLIAVHREADAIPVLEQVVASRSAQGGPNDPRLPPVLDDLGSCLRAMKQHERAIPVFQRALTIRSAAGNVSDPESGASHYGIGISAQELGKFELALEHQMQARDLAITAKNPELEALGHFNVGRALAGLGRHAEAVESFEKSVRMMAQIHGESSEMTREARDELARALVQLGVEEFEETAYSKSVAHLNRANEIRMKDNPGELAARSAILWKLASAERRAGQLAQARKHLEESVALGTRSSGADSLALAWPLELQSLVLAEMKQIKEAVPLFKRALAIRQKAGGEGLPWNIAVRATLLDINGQTDKASAAFEKASSMGREKKDALLGSILIEYAAFLLRHGQAEASKKLQVEVKGLRAARKQPAAPVR
ncbi:MAG: tetratricopeptide repeat protein [Candidatus Wallbacteria bacterium]|nr:tetratricopeptide repeat protein [Candidatus Wallbacteria bacterium]